MNSKTNRKGIWFDPRTKMSILVISVLAASMAPDLPYELGLVLLIALFALLCGRLRMAILGIVGYVIFYFLTEAIYSFPKESTQAVLVAFLGLVHKVYPCGFMGNIIIKTTKVNEFLSAMHKLHVPKALTIPLAIMLRYIPTIREDWQFIKDAMRLRDVSPTVIGFLKHPSTTLECVYTPLLMAASKATDELSIAAVTRGIENPKPRTCFVRIHLRATDYIILSSFVVYFIARHFL
ncbi:MAG: energy-coupling factor transporter transmembrane protein EcfT [Spirochaetia bacterium]|jgi:energy-coupling factor transport system permease protein|nr:energy-coupling factor transporter transmembrane protein EcfT [Spirochaetia bacterium]